VAAMGCDDNQVHVHVFARAPLVCGHVSQPSRHQQPAEGTPELVTYLIRLRGELSRIWRDCGPNHILCTPTLWPPCGTEYFLGHRNWDKYPQAVHGCASNNGTGKYVPTSLSILPG
jgi:hypothetical protein